MNVVFAIVACTGSGDVVLTDVDNFRYSATVDVPLDAIPAGEAEAGLDWSGLTVDLLGQPVTADEVATVTLLNFPELTVEAFATGLAEDSLVQSMLGSFGEQPAVGGVSRLEDFGFEGSPLDIQEQFLPDSGLWVMTLEDAHGETLRFHALEPSDTATELLALVGTEAQILPVVELAPTIALGAPLESIRWADVTTDGLGGELEHHRLDKASVARVDLSRDELEERFAELESLADPRFDVDLEGTVKLDVADLDGFDGLDDGTWVVALSCTTCESPVPKVLAVLSP
ncbi:MAG: hypothetical protein GY913_19450 [Proteobacteria bacterium]|nr:hypothetical protein [Pseudomonadota bacterium]MCP4919087.1 hypothetical protein [Pseudomonadota bacterium]